MRLRAKNPKHKTRKYCNKFNKDFKNGPQKKKKKNLKKSEICLFVLTCKDLQNILVR